MTDAPHRKEAYRRDVGYPLARALSKKDNPKRLEQNLDIQKKRMVLDVVDVVLQLLHRLFHASAVRVTHLSPASDARFRAVANRIVGYLLGQHLDELRPFGPRTDEAHLAFQHIDQLR